MSRNEIWNRLEFSVFVTSRKGRVSRNIIPFPPSKSLFVTSRKGRVSRNYQTGMTELMGQCHVP